MNFKERGCEVDWTGSG